MKHVSIHVSGKVQGVFFRASTKEKAEEFRIKGTVRNNPDGSVSIEAEGDEENLHQFIAWCKIGPRFAHVDRCELNEKPLQNFKGFSIER
jgi:acylphosphatase